VSTAFAVGWQVSYDPYVDLIW